MTNTNSSKQARHISATDAANLVQSGNWLDYGLLTTMPDMFDAALALRKSELRDVKIRSCLNVRPLAVLACDPNREHFQSYSWHFSGYDRKMHDAGLCHYMPCNLGEISDYYRRFIAPSDVFVLKACPMDENGFFNFGAANLWHRAILSRAKLVIVEIDHSLPYMYGVENGLHASEVDYVIDGDNRPPTALTNPPPTDADRTVARLIASEIEDGACIQVGIGAMPNAVCSMLRESGVKNLGIHTEMLTDGIIDLYKAGIVTGSMKQMDTGKLVCSFALGSSDMYAAITRNKDLLCHPVEMTNLPHVMMQNDRLTAINNTTQMDLQGQASSESDGHRHISGTGGQAQFVRGAYASKGGKSFICLSSVYERRGVRKSRIVLNLTPGNVVTATRSDMMYVVTEYGMVNLKGKTIPERAAAMISLAHPDFREGLEREARESGLIPKRLM
jgi:acyl-CoA hydrolase